MDTPIKNLLLTALVAGVLPAAFARSVMTTRLEDPKAVYLSAPEFHAAADGTTDDSGASFAHRHGRLARSDILLNFLCPCQKKRYGEMVVPRMPTSVAQYAPVQWTCGIRVARITAGQSGCAKNATAM